jgi:23S rRNA (adenine2503-C2)-methyltransferase
MGCDFCASTRDGLLRNLTAGEIVEQFLHLRQAALALKRRLRTIVFMGMGEPMHNLPAVLAAIARISHPALGNLGPRNITISTVGVTAGIRELIAARPGVQLAISLHAPDDEIRARIVPSARRFRIADIIAAAAEYQRISGRVTNIEYCLLAGVNDGDEQAQQLATLLRGLRFHVNLIPYNAIGAGVSGQIYQTPSEQRIARFLDILLDAGTVAHIRRPRGDDVSGACGQLRQQVMA